MWRDEEVGLKQRVRVHGNISRLGDVQGHPGLSADREPFRDFALPAFSSGSADRGQGLNDSARRRRVKRTRLLSLKKRTGRIIKLLTLRQKNLDGEHTQET